MFDFFQGLVLSLETITYSDLTILIKVCCLIVLTCFLFFFDEKLDKKTKFITSPRRTDSSVPRKSSGGRQWYVHVCSLFQVSFTLHRRNLKRCFHSGNGSNIFRPHHIREKDNSIFTNLKTQQLPVILGSSLRKNSGRESIKLLYVIIFEKFRFQIVFRRHSNAKPTFSNSSGLKSVLPKRSVSVADQCGRQT